LIDYVLKIHFIFQYADYNNYEDLVEMGNKFNKRGIPTCIDAIAKCEEAVLCCGQLAHILV